MNLQEEYDKVIRTFDKVAAEVSVGNSNGVCLYSIVGDFHQGREFCTEHEIYVSCERLRIAALEAAKLSDQLLAIAEELE